MVISSPHNTKEKNKSAPFRTRPAATAILSAMTLICAQPALADISTDSSGNQTITDTYTQQWIAGNAAPNIHNGKNLTVSSGASLNYSGANAIIVRNGGTPNTITNQGAISATSQEAIKVQGSGSQVTKIDNQGTIQGVSDGISVNGRNAKIETITNASGATISGSSTSVKGFVSAEIYVTGNTASGISAREVGKIGTIENYGTIQGATGILVITGSIDTINNKSGGVISVNNNNNFASGIMLHYNTKRSSWGSNAHIETINNEGTITGSNGIYMAVGTSIDTINNSGTISGSRFGIYGNQNAGFAGQVKGPTIKTINIKSGGSITGGTSGIYLGDAGGQSATIETINIESGGRVVGTNNAGIDQSEGKLGAVNIAGEVEGGQRGISVTNNAGDIKVEATGTVTGNKGAGIVVQNKGNIENITIEGKVESSGGTAIRNYGTATNITVKASGSLTGGESGISIENGNKSGSTIVVNGSVTSNNGSAIKNTGNVESITVSSGGSLNSAANGADIFNSGNVNKGISWTGSSTETEVSISNTGTVGTNDENNQLTINNGNAVIKDWNITLENNKAQEVTTGGNGSVKVEKVTVDSVGENFNPSKPVLIYNVFGDQQSGGVSNVNVSEALKGETGLGDITGENGVYQIGYEAERTVGVLVSQTLASQIVRRDFFLESAITEAAAGALYHRQLEGVNGTVFVKPYFSADNYDFGGAADLDGHTLGLLLGANFLSDKNILTIFAGYEKSDADASTEYSSGSLDTTNVYGGVHIAHMLTQSKNLDTFLKGSAKVAYSSIDIERQLSGVQLRGTGHSEASTNALSYGVNMHIGADWKLPEWRFMTKGEIIPTLGFGFSSGKVDNYEMNGSESHDRYMPERVNMAYSDLTLTWAQNWNQYLRTYISGGYRYNFNTTQTMKAGINESTFEADYELPDSFKYVNATAVLHITPASEVAMGYTGVFDENGHSHNVTAKYELHF